MEYVILFKEFAFVMMVLLVLIAQLTLKIKYYVLTIVQIMEFVIF